VPSLGCRIAAACAYDRGLAIAFCFTGCDAERGDALLAKQLAQFFANVDQRIQIRFIATRERIGNDSHCDCATRRWIDRLTHLAAGLVDVHNQFSNFCFHGRSVQFLLLGGSLSLSIELRNALGRQTTHACMNSCTGRHHQNEHQLISSGGTGY